MRGEHGRVVYRIAVMIVIDLALAVEVFDKSALDRVVAAVVRGEHFEFIHVHPERLPRLALHGEDRLQNAAQRNAEEHGIFAEVAVQNARYVVYARAARAVFHAYHRHEPAQKAHRAAERVERLAVLALAERHTAHHGVDVELDHGIVRKAAPDHVVSRLPQKLAAAHALDHGDHLLVHQGERRKGDIDHGSFRVARVEDDVEQVASL